MSAAKYFDNDVSMRKNSAKEMESDTTPTASSVCSSRHRRPIHLKTCDFLMMTTNYRQLFSIWKKKFVWTTQPSPLLMQAPAQTAQPIEKEKIYQLVLELTSPDARENALLVLRYECEYFWDLLSARSAIPSRSLRRFYGTRLVCVATRP